MAALAGVAAGDPPEAAKGAPGVPPAGLLVPAPASSFEASSLPPGWWRGGWEGEPRVSCWGSAGGGAAANATCKGDLPPALPGAVLLELPCRRHVRRGVRCVPGVASAPAPALGGFEAGLPGVAPTSPPAAAASFGCSLGRGPWPSCWGGATGVSVAGLGASCAGMVWLPTGMAAGGRGWVICSSKKRVGKQRGRRMQVEWPVGLSSYASPPVRCK
jgi:hypothetical protein